LSLRTIILRANGVLYLPCSGNERCNNEIRNVEAIHCEAWKCNERKKKKKKRKSDVISVNSGNHTEAFFMKIAVKLADGNTKEFFTRSSSSELCRNKKKKQNSVKSNKNIGHAGPMHFHPV